MKRTRLFTLVCLMFISMSFAQEKFTVLIDAGHGGKDTGVTHKDILEKDITLDIANLIWKLNENDKLNLQLSRNSDEFLELNKRIASASKLDVDLIISLHVSSAPSEKMKGMEVYISPKSDFYEDSKNYAEKLIPFLSDDDIKIKEANFLLIKKSNAPAMILELGFITNKEDLEFFQSDEGKKEIAYKILKYLEVISH